MAEFTQLCVMGFLQFTGAPPCLLKCCPVNDRNVASVPEYSHVFIHTDRSAKVSFMNSYHCSSHTVSLNQILLSDHCQYLIFVHYLGSYANLEGPESCQIFHLILVTI